MSKQELDLKLVTQGMLSSRNNIKLTFIFKNEAIYQHGVSIIGITAIRNGNANMKPLIFTLIYTKLRYLV